MLTCSVCKENRSFVNTAALGDHLRTHELLGEIRFPMRCVDVECGGRYSKLSNLLRHVDKFHKNEGKFAFGVETNIKSAVISSGSSSHDPTSEPLCQSRYGISEDAVQNEATALVAALRAKSGVSHSHIPEIMQSCQRVLNCQAAWMAQKVSQCVRECDVMDAAALTKVDNVLQSCVTETASKLDNMSSSYKQEKFFQLHPLFVKPIEVTFGSRYEVGKGKNKLVYDTFQYIPVEETLRSLLSNESYVAMAMQNNAHFDDGLIREFQDGESYKTAAVDPTQFSIWIQLFYDGMGTSNPLRGQSSLTNVGIFYFIVKNLPTSFTTCHANVHLLAISYSHDLKVYGFEPILEKFVSEMERLQVTGFCGDFPVIGKKTVKVQFAHAVCDNLALNAMFGFIESFSADYFCTLCLATQSDIQSCFNEKNFMLRTVSGYAADVEKINKGDVPIGRNHSRGVKRDCALNKIHGFHVVSNFSLDPMHIVQEGTIVVGLSCVLHQLMNVKKMFNLAQLNNGIITFFSKNFVDKKNRPPEINSVDPNTGTISPSMKATQLWALCRYLPLIIGHKVPAGDEHWAYLLHLLELVDMIFAPAFTQSMIVFLEQHIADHLEMFVQLFGCTTKLKPKHHLLVHFPSIIRRNGPLIGMSCMRYELKNSFFKRSANIMCNFTNVCKTLAYRHQYYALHAVLSNQHCRHVIQPTGTQVVPLCDLQFCDEFCETVCCEGTSMVTTARGLNLGSLYLRTGCFLVTGSVADDDLSFGRVLHFVSAFEGQWYAVLETTEMLEYETHLHSYAVTLNRRANFICKNIYALRNPYPLYGHEAMLSGNKCYLITLKSHVM
jgi:hypothetical protein